MREEDTLSLNLLSKAEIIVLVGIIQQSLECETVEQFKYLVIKLKKYLAFDYAISGFAKTEDGKPAAYNILNISYPEEWLGIYEKNGYPRTDPIVREHFSGFGLQFWADTYKKFKPTKKFLMEAEDFNLKGGYTTGTRNRSGSYGSIFTLAGSNLERDRHTEVVLKIITPHLHNSMMRIEMSAKRRGIKISFREKEVLNWLKEGKSSWDISAILKVSENTVNFHIKNIMHKFDTVNRTQAVAKAIETGVIGFE
ncbi:MAG: autoinducer binding domain-containing protein [Nitrospiraceae bacterium]|nr:autoinducer binding domain-containing protein [Nitrospiraceae bacterium]